MGIWIILAVVVILAFVLIGMYNGLVRRRKQVDNSWSQIDVQLKRRYDLIPNLVESVKGYAKHEKSVLDDVTKARSHAMEIPAGQTGAKIAAENQLSGMLRSLMVQVEAYPDLKANQNFLQLQEELTSTENKISFARQNYNDTATDYNTSIAVFPANVIASMFNFKDVQLWQIEDAQERIAPKVSF